VQDRIRVLRVIARMNVGGPAYHVSLLSGRLDPARYDTLLVSGRVGPGEGSFDELARRYGAHHEMLDALGPELDPVRDLRSLLALVRIVRRVRPHIVHTHTAKAGMVGRLAARLGGGPRPIVIHTYHGHVLSGYFGRLQEGFYRLLERGLGRISDRLVAVSGAVADELIELHVAPRERFTVVPLGLELDRFLAVAPGDGDAVRTALGLQPDDVLLTTVGRLVPIKRLDVLLEAFARAGGALHLAVVGDGELRADLEAQADRLGIADRVTFLGFRTDLDAIQAATDVAVLSSDNEGTPVALIEAAAAATPAVATRVGGVADVVRPDTGRLVDAGDADGMAAALTELAGDPELRARLGAAARDHVRARFASERLLDDIDALYRRELEERRGRRR
jgi:glycosyltransferase involved in cell wall biosynthesis